MLTDGYFSWLPFPIAASIIVIVASVVMIVYDRYWLRQAAWIGFCRLGIAVTVSLVAILAFDFSVIPNAPAGDVVPRLVRGFFIFMAAFYAVAALVQFVQLRRHLAKQETR